MLMDVQMPGMNGFEVTAAIRNEEKQTGEHLPIIAMTAHAMKGDREHCLEVGMDGYLPKPIQAKALLAEVEQVVRLKEEEKMLPNQRDEPKSPILTPVTEGVLDRAAALARAEGDVELLGEMAALFVQDYPKLLVEIRESVKGDDPQALARAAHNLKGSVANFCAPAAFQAALRLETLGSNGDLSFASQACAELEEAIQDLEAALEQLVGIRRG